MSARFASLGLETLEDRAVPATLQLVGNALFYTSAAGVANNVTVSHSAGVFTFTDSVEGTTFTHSSAGIAQVDVNTGDLNDVVTIQNTPAAVRVTGGTGADTVNIGNGTLDGILATVTVVGDGGGDRTHLMDYNDTTNNFYLVSTGKIDRNGATVVQHSNQALIRLNAGQGADLIDVTANTPGTMTYLDGGAGSDTMTGSNVMNTWSVTGVNQVSLSVINIFSNTENILGGFNDNTVVFYTGGEMSGWFQGGGGINTLSYVNLSENISVNLLNGSASKLGGGVVLNTVDNVYGGSGNDTITGDANNNILDGGAGNDTISGRGGNDILLGGAGDDYLVAANGRDILIGGTGRDNLNAGGGEDILIGGSTTHDSNKAALDSFRNLWLSGDSYATRVATLKAAGLDAANVPGDGATDFLTGGAGLDWFWDEGITDTLTDWFWLEFVN